MGTLPTLQVLLDNGTGAFPFDVTSKVLSLDGYRVSRGRSDWIGAVTAGDLTLTLNNSDGRFTPGSTILASPSPIMVDQQVRVVVTGAGGGLSQFTGYVKSWPVTWPAVVPSFAEVQVTATDAQARAERHPLRSMLEEEVMLGSPSAYYTLGEAAGSTSAGDTSGNQAPPLTITGTGAALTFGSGIGPGTDGLTAAMFAGGQYLASSSGTLAVDANPYALMVAFNVSAAPTQPVTIAGQLYAPWSVNIATSGVVYAYAPGSGVILGPSVVDGKTHVAALHTVDGAVARLWVDGVDVGHASMFPAGVTVPGRLVVGGPARPPDVSTTSLTGTVSHVAEFRSGLSVAGIAAIYTASIGAAESGTARLTRLAAYAGIPVGTLDTSLTDVPAQATSGRFAWEAIQEVADAELGLVYVDGGGSLTFHNRNRVTSKTAPDLILDRQWLTTDVAPVVDDQQIINYSEVTATGTGSTQLARDVVSEVGDGTATHPGHGRYPGPRSYLVQTDAEALDRANWIVGKFAEPTPRYGTLTINLYNMTPTQASTVLSALDLDCWLRVTSMSSQNPGGATADVVVQGFSTTATGESWTVTCNVVARSLYAAWILGDPTYGVLGSTTLLGV